MSIFKRKPKGEKIEKDEKGAAGKGEKGSKEDTKKQAVGEKAPQQPYKPTHAASNAVRKAPTVNGGKLSLEVPVYAHGGVTFHQPPATSVTQPFSHAGMRRVVTGTNPLPPYRGFSGAFNVQQNNSAEVFTTDPDPPPLPTSSTSEHSQSTPRNGPACQNSGYFSQRRDNAPGFDSPMLGNPKMAMATRHRGDVNPHTISDSGYGSTAHSRAPSEQMNTYELAKLHLPRDSSGFLPELSLSEELARDPAVSEASFGADEVGGQRATTPKQPDSILRNGKGYFSQLGRSNDSSKVKSCGSRRTTLKQTRFEQEPEILDEEAEIIGELIERDIMDCVRQRCNGYGDVLDDYGRVVGRVQPMEHMLDSPILRVASPGPSPAPVIPQQNYFASQVQQLPPRSHTPSGKRPTRRESTASQREVFTPACQRQSQNHQASMAWELRDHLANANTQSRQVVAPAEYPDNATAVELDAWGTQSEDDEEEEEEVTPIFDYSEVFMPVPSVPPRTRATADATPPQSATDITTNFRTRINDRAGHFTGTPSTI
ncbi:hypothetical protein B0A55_06267 [Friedmanniomyces simplex]|uniref:Uncharacterized protein n=1 Tax=Friedmanniomyces simplex TaxID=329884 RepID=A0A4U0XVV2_9PEZI|nr:hypothetical protein B0A55_06267 [Friedmanniomyces simplex]